MLKASADWAISRPNPAREPNSSTDKAASDAELEPGENERHGRRQRHFEENLPRARAEGAQHLDQALARGAQPRLGVDSPPNQPEKNDLQYHKPDADAEP